MLSSSNQAIVVAFYVLCCWQAVVQSFATLPSTATSLLHLARLSSSMTASTSSLPSISSTRLAMANDDRSLLEQMRKTLGEREDILEGAEMENKQLLQGLRDMDRDPNLRINNKFIEWLSTNGVWVKTVSTWGRAPHPLVIASNTEADGESCGRGLLAREGMGEGELLMTIPLDLCLTKATAQDVLGRDVITEDMDEYIAISLLLMTEKLKGDNSKWKAYMDILPSAENVYPSFIWSDDDLNMLLGSPVYAASKSLRAKLEKEYNMLYASLKSFGSRIAVDRITFDLFQWSFVMLLSRAARLTSKSTGEELALVPYADLMNHNPYSNTYIDAQKSGMPLMARKEEVAVYADRAYKKFEQVFINYGEKGNGDLLLLYGFALDRNPFDSVEIAVGLSSEDPLYSQKRRYLEKSGRGVTSVRFPLQRSRYPSELVDFLRLLLVEPDDVGIQAIERLNFNEPISPSLERRVLTTIITICESYLEQYPTSLQEDEVLLVDKKLLATLSRQQRMAIKLRASEKRILQQTIKAVEEELQKLPQVIDKDTGEIIQAGRSFDVLKSSTLKSKTAAVPSLTNTFVQQVGKQMGTFIDIKDGSDGKKKANRKTEDEEEDDDDEEKPSMSIAERRRRRRSS